MKAFRMSQLTEVLNGNQIYKNSQPTEIPIDEKIYHYEVGEIEVLPIFEIGTTVVLNNEMADHNLSESGKLKHNYEVDKNVCN